MDSDSILTPSPGGIYLLCAAGTVQHALGHGVRQLRGSCTGLAFPEIFSGPLSPGRHRTGCALLVTISVGKTMYMIS